MPGYLRQTAGYQNGHEKIRGLAIIYITIGGNKQLLCERCFKYENSILVSVLQLNYVSKIISFSA